MEKTRLLGKIKLPNYPAYGPAFSVENNKFSPFLWVISVFLTCSATNTL